MDVQALARQAVEKLKLRGADIGIAPKPTGRGVVGMPVWIWNRPGPARTGPTSASAAAGGVTVTATARVRRVVYAMGDGGSVTCTSKGTPYKAEYGKRKSPDCGHLYTQPSTSEPDGRYAVTATTTWDVDWAGAGQTGQITTTRTAATSMEIREVQVLN